MKINWRFRDPLRVKHLSVQFSSVTQSSPTLWDPMDCSTSGFPVCYHSRSYSTEVAQTVKRLPTMRETWVWSLGWEFPLEKEMATHSSTLTWKIPWTEEPGRLQSMGSQRVGHDWATSLHFSFSSGTSQPRDRIQFSYTACGFFTGWATTYIGLIKQNKKFIFIFLLSEKGYITLKLFFP